MRFEIINPSDPYTIDAEDLEIGALACCLLGDGKYGLRGMGESNNQDVPIFLLGGHDEWFTSKFGRNFEASLVHALEKRNEALAKSLDSVALFDGYRRSSMNNIGARAKSLSKAVREKAT